MTHWHDVPNFHGLYQVCPGGQVRSVDRHIKQGSRHGHLVANFHHGRILKPYQCKNGRRCVVLHDHAHRRHLRYIDRLVNEVFGRQDA